MVEAFDFELFENRVGERFRIDFVDGAAVETELVAAERVAATGIGRKEPFSLIFRAPEDAHHEQRIYRIGHDELGSFELFLVPLQPDEHGPLYQAVFA